MRHRCWILPCLALALVACQSGMPPKTLPQATAQGAQGRPCPPTSVAQAPKPFVYRLGIGDEITVSIWQEKDVTAAQRVLPDGTVVGRTPLAATSRRARSGRAYARAELALPERVGAAPTGRWTVEVRLRDDPVARHSIFVGERLP